MDSCLPLVGSKVPHEAKSTDPVDRKGLQNAKNIQSDDLHCFEAFEIGLVKAVGLAHLEIADLVTRTKCARPDENARFEGT